MAIKNLLDGLFTVSSIATLFTVPTYMALSMIFFIDVIAERVSFFHELQAAMLLALGFAALVSMGTLGITIWITRGQKNGQ